MFKKFILFIISFSLITFVSCFDDDEADSNVVLVKSLSPEAEATLSYGDTLTAEIHYNIKDFNKDAQYTLRLFFQTQQGELYSSSVGDEMILTSSSGSVTYTVVLEDFFFNVLELAYPFTCYFELSGTYDYYGVVSERSSEIIYN